MARNQLGGYQWGKSLGEIKWVEVKEWKSMEKINMGEGGNQLGQNQMWGNQWSGNYLVEIRGGNQRSPQSDVHFSIIAKFLFFINIY